MEIGTLLWPLHFVYSKSACLVKNALLDLVAHLVNKSVRRPLIVTEQELLKDRSVRRFDQLITRCRLFTYSVRRRVSKPD